MNKEANLSMLEADENDQPAKITQSFRYFNNKTVTPALVFKSGFDISLSEKSAFYMGLAAHIQLAKNNQLVNTLLSNGVYWQEKGAPFKTSYFALEVAYKLKK